ncbi:unnamed protein product [Porites lobata]|uniref:G-protein coupled receptors family 1 profile domain-containing protein n=1 Tax=Porites lobata TaxID=104759 RepID=A0ABN8PNG5_9CNID|nr:unnamed protein product [Porites lobata]
MNSTLSNSSNVTNGSLAPIFPPVASTIETSSNPVLRWALLLAYSVICLSGVCGNLMVILASRKPGMVTVSNILIANLAVADFTVCFVNIPTVATYGFLVYWPFGAFLCKLISFLQGLTLSASVGTLVAIAGERYWHIVLYTRRKLTIREANKAVAVIWATSIFMPLPLAVFSTVTKFKQGEKEFAVCIEEWPSVKSRQSYTVLVFLLLYLLPLLIIASLYARVGRFLRRLPTAQQVTNHAQTKAIRMLSTVVFLFAICWLPYHIVLMYTELSYSKLSQALTSVILLAQWLVFANSTFNPFVYAVLNENYRCKFKMLLHLRRRNRRRNNVIIRVQTIRNENLR